MRKTALILSLALLVAGTVQVTAENVGKDITPAEFSSLSEAERQAAAQALKDADSAQARPGFQGTLRTGTNHLVPARTANISITYDTGTFTGVGDIPAIADNFAFGNNFDSISGGPVGGPKNTVTITQLTAFMAIVDGSTTGTGGAFATIFGPPVGTIAPSLTSANIAGLQAGTFNTIAIGATITGTNLNFMAGIWNPTAGSTAGTTPCATDCVGFDNSGTVAGQGNHGMAVEDFGGGNFTPSTTANAMLRATGNLVPVELMSFSID